jgi:hypothetical protein
MTWIPERQLHDRLCECGGEGLLPSTMHDERGDRYTVWRPCKGTGPWRPDYGPEPEMSWEEYTERRPNWFAECGIPDARDHEYARRAARTIVQDHGCIPFPPNNPLASLVAKYVEGYRHAKEEAA